MPAKKRPKIDGHPLVAIVNSNQSVRSLLECFRESNILAGSTTTARRLATKELYKTVETPTPYGKVCNTSTLQGKNGPLDVKHLNMFAFFYHACSISDAFATFLYQIIGGGELRLVLYLDKAVPGQANRHDDGRSQQCIYFSALEFPYWWRSRRNGWIPMTYINCHDQKEAKVSDAMLVRFIVRTFCSRVDSPSLINGIKVPLGSKNTMLVRGKFCLTISDWEQVIKTYDLVGYNGSVPCGVCRNVLGRREYFVDDYFVHITSHEHEKFDLHSNSTVLEVTSNLEHVAKHNPRGLKLAQQSSGHKYTPDGIFYDPEVSCFMQPPYCEYGDWMHHLVTSGGVGQYHLNQFAMVVMEVCEVSAAEIDTWVQGITLPKNYTKLHRRFFSERIVHNTGSHCKAFASDVLSAIMCLGFFVDAVISPLEIEGMQEYIDCFALLRAIIRIFTMADKTQIPLLKETIKAHHVLFAKLYAECCKPKLHALAHVAWFWEYWEALLSCWGPERHHKIMKKVMRRTFRNASKTALAFDLRRWFNNLSDESLYKPVHLAGTVRRLQQDIVAEGHVITLVAWSLLLNTETGHIYKSDLLQFGDFRLGRVLGFVEASISGLRAFYAICAELTQSREQFWQEINHESTLVHSSMIVGAVPYVYNDGCYIPLLLS